MSKKIDMTAQKFGRLRAIKIVGKNKQGQVLWLFKCEGADGKSCGKEVVLSGVTVRHGNTSSCGCLRKEMMAQKQFKHGYANRRKVHPLYNSWAHAKERCLNPNCFDYPNYGGRGIYMYQEWVNDFRSFLRDVKNLWSLGTTIERIDVNKGYVPDNIKFIPNSHQARNRRVSLIFERNGKYQNLREWMDEFNSPVSRQTAYQRIKKFHWDWFTAITTPTKKTLNV